MSKIKPKIIRAVTIPQSLDFCIGMFRELSSRYEMIALSSPNPPLYAFQETEGCKGIGVPMERRISFLKDLNSLYRLVHVFSKEKPDMVHSMTPKAGLLCMMAAWMARVPVRVHTFTGLVWPTSKGMTRRILMATDWITCACATHVIPEGYGVMEDLQKHITKKPMRVLGYGNVRGIDLTYWDKKTLKGEKVEALKRSLTKVGLEACADSSSASTEVETPFTFLFVGRIVGDKGINELVKSFTKLKEMIQLKNEKNKECRLVLVGRYEDELDPVSAETRQLIDSMPEIMAVGPQYGDDLLAWYAASDCFVFPSYREGYPNTVIEAGAMEKPCIVTDINGCREIIRPSQSPLKGEDLSDCNSRLNPGERMSIRENGVVIPSKDVDALYDAMLWMMEHADERQKMGKRAREIVAERWEQGFVREKLYEFYREVLGE